MLGFGRSSKNTGKIVAQASRIGWPTVALALIVVAPLSFVIYKMTRAVETIGNMPGEVAERFGKAVAPKIEIKNVVMSTIEEMQKKSKLVVLDTTIDLDVTKDESYTAAGFVYLGTNRVRMIARDNRIQYVIGLQQTKAEDFSFDEKSRKLTLFVPRPALDEEMASVQSDPAKCYAAEYSGGWMRFDLRETLKHTQEMLRPALLEQARRDMVVKEADTAGIAAIRTFVEPMAAKLKGEGIAVEVAYR